MVNVRVYAGHGGSAERPRGIPRIATRHGVTGTSSIDGAACSTENFSPAMVSDPNCCTLAFCATEYETVPFPDPVAPAVMVSQVKSLRAVQPHPVGAITDTLPWPPPR